MIGTYAQDQWTLVRFTVNAGLRWDYFRGGYPDGGIPAAPWAAAKTWEGADPVVWNDLSPRLGLVYDLTGNGRTALKVTANRYVTGFGTVLVGNAVNPALLNSRDQRFWLDGADGHPGLGIPLGFGIFPGCIPSAADPTGSSCIPGDAIAQCDPRNPLPNGECIGGTSNNAFGTFENTSSFDPDWAEGFGQRSANWEFSGGVQHELTTGLSVNVTYFRRAYVNFSADQQLISEPRRLRRVLRDGTQRSPIAERRRAAVRLLRHQFSALARPDRQREDVCRRLRGAHAALERRGCHHERADG